jgi:ATP synthase protein I
MDSREDLRKFPETIGAKETRKLKVRREAHHSIWFGMGMFGVVGWSVAVPTVLGVIIGAWIDRSWPSRYSWTLMLLFMGVVLGGSQRLVLVTAGRRCREEKENAR